jgi:hypothetical protein
MSSIHDKSKQNQYFRFSKVLVYFPSAMELFLVSVIVFNYNHL